VTLFLSLFILNAGEAGMGTLRQPEAAMQQTGLIAAGSVDLSLRQTGSL
jgi:hypothetical protein